MMSPLPTMEKGARRKERCLQFSCSALSKTMVSGLLETRGGGVLTLQELGICSGTAVGTPSTLGTQGPGAAWAPEPTPLGDQNDECNTCLPRSQNKYTCFPP